MPEGIKDGSVDGTFDESRFGAEIGEADIGAAWTKGLLVGFWFGDELGAATCNARLKCTLSTSSGTIALVSGVAVWADVDCPSMPNDIELAFTLVFATPSLVGSGDLYGDCDCDRDRDPQLKRNNARIRDSVGRIGIACVSVANASVTVSLTEAALVFTTKAASCTRRYRSTTLISSVALTLLEKSVERVVESNRKTLQYCGYSSTVLSPCATTTQWWLRDLRLGW